MQKYEVPEMDIILFKNEDVITASTRNPEDNELPDTPII